MSREFLSPENKKALIINNRYIIEDLINNKLGEGGVGVVYKALDKQAANDKEPYVVAKILHQSLIHDKWIINKFNKETQAIVKKISHKGVVKGIEAGVLEDERPYLLMEYIKGESLRDLIKRNLEGIELERSANILKQLGIALSAIHKANVYHRDLKPENIMLYFKENEEYIKIIDFGIATVKESSDQKTQTTQIAGTPVYMAPEQIMEGKPTARSDIYAMSVIAYEMLTGRRPFTVEAGENTFISLYQQQMAGLQSPPKLLRRKLSDEVDNLIRQALEFDQNNRFTSAEEFGIKLCKALLESASAEILLDTPSFLKKQKPLPIRNADIDSLTLSPKSSVNIMYPIASKTLVSLMSLVIFLTFSAVMGKIFFSSSENSKTLVPLPTPSIANIFPSPKIINKINGRVAKELIN